MPWQSPGNYQPSDRLHSDDLNKLHQDDVAWGGDVNGGGYKLSNVVLEGVSGLGTGSAVTSVFTRSGDVVALATDYAAFYVPQARQVIAGVGMSGGGPLTSDITLTALVTSVFGRTGAITLTPADVTGATGVLSTRRVNTGLGLSGGGALTADLNLAAVPDSVNQQVQVLAGAALTGTRHAINFVNGANVTVGVVDNPGSNRVDVTISSTGGAGGMVDPTTTKGDVIVRGLAAPNRLAVGADGQVLTADSTQALGVKWAAASGAGAVTSVFTRTGAVVAASGDYSASQVTNAVDSTISYNNPPWIATLPWAKITNPPAFMLDPTLAAGDLIVHAATTTRLPVGADGSILTADSTQAAGMRWGTVAVTTVFGRSGAVVAQTGDYTVAMVTNAVANTRNINTSTGLTGGGNLSADRTLSVVSDTTNQQIQVLLGGTNIGTRHAINFVNGAGVAMTIADDPTDNRINLTVASSGTGSGGGLVDPTTAKGDLIVRGASAPPQALPVGANGQVLTADNSQLLGMAWTTPAGGGAGSQTPWQSDINAALWSLNFVKSIGVNITSAAATARILIQPSATEEGVKTIINAAPALASMSVVNDIADYLHMRSYGTGYAATPALAGLTTVESSTKLALFASASEVMRLVAGHVLIGTVTDDGTHMLQVNGGVKSGSGGFTFPDGTTQTTAYTSASSPVTSVFTRTGAVVAVAGDYTAAQVTHAVDQTQGYADPAWITSLAWSKITGAPAAAAQTPWTSNINAATFTLYSAGMIGVGNDATVTPDGNVASHLIVGPTTVSALRGEITTCGNTTTLGFAVGAILFANYANTGPEKRVASIFGLLDGAINSGAMTFTTWSAGTPTERMRITAAGNVGIGVTPAYRLDVSSSTATIARFAGSAGLMYFQAGTGVPTDQQFWNAAGTNAVAMGTGVPGGADTNDFVFSTYGGAWAERMRILTGGGVTVTGSINVAGTVSATGPFVTSAKGSTFGTAVGPLAAPAPTDAGVILYNNSAGNWAGIGTDSNGDIWFRTGLSGTPNPRMAIVPGGTVMVGPGIPALAPVDSLMVLNALQPPTLTYTAPAGIAAFVGNNVNIGLEIGGYPSGSLAMWMQARDFNGAIARQLVLNPLGGNIGIGTSAPRSALSIVSANQTTFAGASQLTVCEQGNNAGYQVSLGYYYDGNVTFNGVIQSLSNSGGSTLYLNPSGGAVNAGANLIVGGTIYGGAAALQVPALNCPVYTSNPNMPNNTCGFTVNEAGNYATFWVRFSNGTLHIFSTTLTTAP